MKIRTDFVTNSSSASYILEIYLIDENKKMADFWHAVSPEDGGDEAAESIYLIPEVKNGEICFGGKSLSTAKSLEELCELLFSAAIIEGLCDEDGEYPKIPLQDAVPKEINRFLNYCKKQGISANNLETIVIRNSKYGSGDSAMWIECDDLLSSFEEFYKQQGEGRESHKLHALIEYVKSDPVLPANDNDSELSGEELCVWNSNYEYLSEEMDKLLNRKLSGEYWMAQYSNEYIIDVNHRKIENRKVLYYGSEYGGR